MTLKQVYVGQVAEINPIDGADRIESLTVVAGEGGKWRGTAQKGQFRIKDYCEVYLPDSLLPQEEKFAFMEKYHYRVNMCRFKGVPSEVLIMPLKTSFPQTYYRIGDNITPEVGVTKYEKPMPANISGVVRGDFPSFISKTDEPNFQKVPEMVQALQGKDYYSSVKVDGSSVTIYYKDGHFGCCSRNLELKKSKDNVIWKIAEKYQLREWCIEHCSNYAFQMEAIGEGIQKNPLGLKGVEPRVFNIYDIDNRVYLPAEDVVTLTTLIGIPMVEIVDWDETFDFQSNETLQKYAEGLYPNGKQREGVVIRPMEEMIMPNTGERLSFKVINLNYKN